MRRLEEDGPLPAPPPRPTVVPVTLEEVPVSRSRTRLTAIATVVALLAAIVPAASAAKPVPPPPAPKPSTDKAIFFASDGMRPDLVDKYVGEGAMPTYAAMYAAGVKGANGLKQAFPPNTGVGWYTLATGTWPGEHGSTNNTFHRTGEGNFNDRTSLGASILQADTIQQAAERAGKKVASVEWVGSRTHNLAGPTSTSATSSRPAACSPRRSTPPSRRAPPRSACRTRSPPSHRRPAGRTCRPATRPLRPCSPR